MDKESGDGFTYRLGDDVPRLRLGDLLAAAAPGCDSGASGAGR